MTALPVTRERDLRVGAAALLGTAAVWSRLPVHPPFACPLRSLTGIPCPLCGMTRACVAAAHGNFVSSLRFNPGGIFVMLLAVVLLVRPSWVSNVRPPTWAIWLTLGALWIWNIGFNPTFHQLFLR